MSPHIEIGIDCREPEDLARFWAAALGYEIGELFSDGVYLKLLPPSPDRPVVYFQRVPEDKSVKNRVHLDLYVKDLDAEVARLSDLGARRLGEERIGVSGVTWQVMVDPEINEFCVCVG
jgi:hypothetical protein